MTRYRPPARLAVTIALATGMLLGSGCGRGGEGSSPGGRPIKVLRLGNGAEPQDLDPEVTTGVPEYNIIQALFEGLLSMDPKDLHPVPGLAESWDISPDGLVYTFHLRPNLKWSNGDPITAGDFVASYRRELTPAFGCEYAYLLYDFVQGAEEYYEGKLTDFDKVGFKTPDDRTLVVTLKHPTPFLLRVIAQHDSWYAVPTRVIAKFAPLDQRGSAWTRPGNLVGDGPFILKSWVPQQKIVVVRNPLYWDAATVKLDEIEFYPIEDITADEHMFRTGQLDVTYELPPDKVDVYRREHPEELRIDPYLGIYYYEFNVRVPPLDDKRVRQALAMSIDREKIVRDVSRGGERPAYSSNYPGIAGYTPRAHLVPDLARARQLLAEAGYPGGKGFPHLQLLYNTYLSHRLIAEAIQAMWRKNLGIDIELRNEEWKVYQDSVHTHAFQIARRGWIADYIDPEVFLEIWQTGNGNNDSQFSNAEFDRLFETSLSAKDDKDRYEIYQKMDAILVDECPLIPIYYYTRFFAISPRVKGWWPTLLALHPYKYVDIEPPAQ